MISSLEDHVACHQISQQIPKVGIGFDSEIVGMRELQILRKGDGEDREQDRDENELHVCWTFALLNLRFVGLALVRVA